jgi:hypothetical protein
MKKIGSLFVFFSLCFLNVSISLAGSLSDTLNPALRIDLQRIEETWRILDRYADHVWPGWNNYVDVPFQIEYPNGLRLHIGEPNSPNNFKLVHGFLVRGKNVYINSSRLNSLVLSTRHYIYGGGVGMGKHPTMRVRAYLITPEKEKTAEEEVKALGNPNFSPELPYSTDYSIFVLMHELFHCFANYAPLFWSDQKIYEPDLNYAVYAEIEGDLLEKVAYEPTLDSLKADLRKFLAVRAMRREGLLDYQKAYESGREKADGTAEYVDYKIIDRMKSGFERGISHEVDPLYFGFRYASYFHLMTMRNVHETRKNTLLASGKVYGNGLFMCLILDKLMPAWKKDLFTSNSMLDDLIVQTVQADKTQDTMLIQEIKRDYAFEALAQRHGPAIAERDSVIEYFQIPNNRYFVIDFDSLGLSPEIVPHGKRFERTMAAFYSRGIKTAKVGDLTIEGREVPACFDYLTHTFRFVETGLAGVPLKYNLKYIRKDSDGVFFDVNISTQEFNLHATKVKIFESTNEVKFKILPGPR